MMIMRTKVALTGLAAVVAIGVGPAVFAANPANVAAGTTVAAWKYTYQGAGVGNIVIMYSNGQHQDVSLTGPWLSSAGSWSAMDSVAPLLAAAGHGYSAQVAGAFPTGIGLTFSGDAKAAMTVQNFNPAQVGGQALAPSASTLTSTTKAWLSQVGWSSTLTAYQKAHGATSPTPAPSKSPAPPTKTPTGPSKSKPTPKHTPAPKSKAKKSQPVTPSSTGAKHTATPTTAPSKSTTGPSKSKPLPVTSKVTPVPTTVATTPSPSVPLQPTTPYLAHHHVSRSHAVLADAHAKAHKTTSSSAKWPWVVVGVVIVGGGVVALVRRRLA